MTTQHHSARELTGGTTTSLDRFTTASLNDGKTHICWTFDSATNKIYAHVFDSTSTEAESSPDYIRPDDYSSGGVWVLVTSPFDVSAGKETGSIEFFTMSTVPTGYLECDGSAISRSTYSALFAVIGETYGAGDGVNTFNIPDARGEFIRCWDHGAGNDPDAATRSDRGDGTTGDYIGTKQESQNLEHTHTFLAPKTSSNSTAGTYVLYTSTTTGTTNPSGGDEARPRNINFLVAIKY